jgi:hypothetical protein
MQQIIPSFRMFKCFKKSLYPFLEFPHGCCYIYDLFAETLPNTTSTFKNQDSYGRRAPRKVINKNAAYIVLQE